MANRVVLHVGAMKSGTTYLQSTLFANKATLASQGVLVPGRTWGQHSRATRDVLGRTDLPGRRSHAGAWQQVLDEIDAWPGTAVFSMELMGSASPAGIRRVMGSFPHCQVEVVLSLRDLNRSIRGMWQETIQNGRSWTWPDYHAALKRGRPRVERAPGDVTRASRTFWMQQNSVRLARRWADVAGGVTLLTVPPPGAAPTVLWNRFAELVGFDPVGMVPGERVNTAVGAGSAEVLRALNAELDRRGRSFPWSARLRKKVLAKSVLAARRADEPQIGLPVADWVGEQAATMTSELKQLQPRLVGAWADLTPVDVPGIDPATVDQTHVLAAAEAALVGMHAAVAARYPAWSGAPNSSGQLATRIEALADLLEQVNGEFGDFG
ncbi:hypothetical protein [Nocardioides limicola]|uniref:hypothetical protein n=1 Tax=Nocardioides limicola TaxID=2803368 RepID=UPI00193C66AC|nr:hypothetical protein [Nocardioides sp. DJM-14]